MGRFPGHHFPTNSLYFACINIFFYSKHMLFDTNIISSKSLKFKRKEEGFVKQVPDTYVGA